LIRECECLSSDSKFCLSKTVESNTDYTTRREEKRREEKRREEKRRSEERSSFPSFHFSLINNRKREE